MKTIIADPSGSCGQSSSRSRVGLVIASGLISLALVAFGNVTEFPGSGAIAIPSIGNATPYPSGITPSGIDGNVIAVRVKINGFSHSLPDDVDVLLVSPGGQVCAVFSDAIGSGGITNVNLVFDDAAATVIPDSGGVASGSYRPANYDPIEGLPPVGSGTIGTNLTALAAGGVSGLWRLYVRDDASLNAGSVTSWALVIETDSPPGPEIAVEQPSGTNLADGGGKDFGSINLGTSSSLAFTIRNVGSLDLTGLGITVDGPDAAMFAVTADPAAPVVPGGNTTFTVRFTPASLRSKSAVLHLANNDAGENPFDVPLAGSGLPGASEAWVRRYSGPESNEDRAQAVAVDGSGNVVVTGHSNNGFNNDYYTAKYAAANGALIWEKRYDGSANSQDEGKAVAVDGSGNVVVTGESWNGTSYDYYTAKYAAADGALLWEKNYNGPANSHDYGKAVAVDGSGNAVVTGHSWNGSDDDYATIMYAAADGAVLWDERYNGTGNFEDKAVAVAVDSSGNVAVTGNSVGAGNTQDYYTVKYAAADGTPLWGKRYDGPAINSFDYAFAVGVDASGNVVVTGDSASDYYTVKYAAADGGFLWEKRYNGPTGNLDRAKALALDDSGNVVVTGESYNGTDLGFYTAKYAALNGALLWEKRYHDPVSGSDSATAVAVDSSGNVVVTGDSYRGNVLGYDYYTAKYAAADGSLFWEKHYNDPANSADNTAARRCLAVGPGGIVAVTGSSFISPATTGYDYATVVYREFLVLTAQEYWRQIHFDSPTNTGNGADAFDYDSDGILNLVEYAMGLNPKLNSAGQLPLGQIIGPNFVISFTQPDGVSGITCGAEWSTTMQSNDWHPVADIGSGNQHVFSVPMGSQTRLFMRLTITAP